MTARDGCRSASTRSPPRPLPDRLVVVDTGSTDGSADLSPRTPALSRVVGDLRTISAPRHTTFGAAVSHAVADLPPAAAGDWLVAARRQRGGAADSRPAGRRGPPFELGRHRRSQADPVGRPRPAAGGRDPGQPGPAGAWAVRSAASPTRDSTTTAAMSSASTHRACWSAATCWTSWAASTGRSPLFRDDLDLCWRAHLAGHRVIVVPQARMREAGASAIGTRRDDLGAAAARRPPTAGTAGRWPWPAARCSPCPSWPAGSP